MLQVIIWKGIIVQISISSPSTRGKSKQGKTPKQRKPIADEEGDVYLEFLRAQTKIAKKREEQRAQLFTYLKMSDEQTHNLMISAIGKLGEVLKGGNSSKS